MKAMSIVVPPLAEQHRIVSKIDALFSELDKGVEMLKTIQQQLRMYRQAVLKWAFEGKDWEYKSFASVAPSRLGKMLDKQKNTGNLHKYLRNINVRWLEFDCSDLLEMRIEDDELEKYLVKKGDLLICEGGEPGRCAIWKSEQTIAFQKALHRVRPTREMTSEFLMYFIYFLATTGELKSYFTGSGIKHLTGESLNRIPVPIPTQSEQEHIVSAIESRLSVCDKLEQLVDENLSKAQALRQSILKKAFAGELVPQDLNDEAAEILLERIKGGGKKQ
jgi:type I restriction enzyme S subunit